MERRLLRRVLLEPSGSGKTKISARMTISARIAVALKKVSAKARMSLPGCFSPDTAPETFSLNIVELFHSAFSELSRRHTWGSRSSWRRIPRLLAHLGPGSREILVGHLSQQEGVARSQFVELELLLLFARELEGALRVLYPPSSDTNSDTTTLLMMTSLASFPLYIPTTNVRPRNRHNPTMPHSEMRDLVGHTESG